MGVGTFWYFHYSSNFGILLFVILYFSQKAPCSSPLCPGRTRSSSPGKRSDFEVKSNYILGIIEKWENAQPFPPSPHRPLFSKSLPPPLLSGSGHPTWLSHFSGVLAPKKQTNNRTDLPWSFFNTALGITSTWWRELWKVTDCREMIDEHNGYVSYHFLPHPSPT